MLPLAGITNESIVDGPGIRMVIFFQGCPHHCPGCHNPETHPFAGGILVSTDEILTIVRSNPLLSGITFSGGEPFAHVNVLAEFISKFKNEFGNLTLGAYTGYTYEELLLLDRALINEILFQLDFLIDGRFILAEKADLPYRGSKNQRYLILKGGKIAEIL